MSVSKGSNNDKSNLFEGDIYSSIVNSIKIDNIIPKKGIKNSNNICIAAKRHSTKESSLDDLKNGRTVVLIKESSDGRIPTYSSYTLCSRSPTKCNNTLCYSHDKTIKENLKIFKELKDLENTIIPTVNHEYYKNKGERGAKKKNSNLKNNLVKNSNDSSIENINKILSCSDKKLITILEDCARKINNEFDLNKSSLSSSSVTVNKVDTNINVNVNDDSDSEEVNFTNNDSEDISNIIIKHNNDNMKQDLDQDLDQDEIDEDEIDEDEIDEDDGVDEDDGIDEDGLDAEEIQTINGRKFYVDENLIVYEPIEDSFNVVGNLIIIDKKYKQIEYNNKDYSIFTKEIKNGKTFFKCFLTDKKFDTDMKFFK